MQVFIEGEDKTMSNTEAIIVDGVRYDKVEAKTEFVCEECELREVCESLLEIGLFCYNILEDCEC